MMNRATPSSMNSTSRIDVKQARETLRNEKDAVYLDVRTAEEFAAGHPVGARAALRDEEITVWGDGYKFADLA